MKYPNQLEVSKRDNLTLNVDHAFSLKKPDDEAPLGIFSEFSRYILNIGDKSSKTGVKANLAIKDYPYFIRKMNSFLDEIIKKSFFSNTVKPKLPAYTVQIMRQGTAAEIIKKTNNTEYIIKLKNSLEANLKKYATNAVQIEAIDNAVDLFNNGLLEDCKDDSANGNVITIWTQPDKYFRDTKTENGETYNMCYSFEITYTIGYSMPFEIRISNYYAPLGKSSKNEKLTTIKKSSMKYKKEYSYKLTEGEMIAFLDQMEYFKVNFMSMCYKNQFTISYNEFMKNLSVSHNS